VYISFRLKLMIIYMTIQNSLLLNWLNYALSGLLLHAADEVAAEDDHDAWEDALEDDFADDADDDDEALDEVEEETNVEEAFVADEDKASADDEDDEDDLDLGAFDDDEEDDFIDFVEEYDEL